MLGLIRIGAYLLSGVTLWQFLGGGAPDGTLLGRPLALDSSQSMLFGVCAGVSKYTGIDVSLLRFGWALACLYRGVGIVLYILAFLIMPVQL